MGDTMKTRKKEYGNVNMVGQTIEKLRKAQKISQKDFISRMQTLGCDINPTSYSKLEGQIRIATDKELYTIARILNVPVDSLFPSPAE
ncbi:MAG: helix-turn-helix transcriptional regulator [Ruminococcaceae bacterium]|nr:helix-turn-helix transcriptional regulator [Oscillospiraceae bacterium]